MSASTTPTIDAIMADLTPRDDDDILFSTFRPKSTPTSPEDDKPTTTTHPKPTSKENEDDKPTPSASHPKSSTHAPSTTKKSPSPTTLSTKVSKSSKSTPSSTASFNPYPYPLKANSAAPSQPSPSSAAEKKLAALRKSKTNMGIVIAVFVILFVLMAAFQIWYWFVWKPKRVAMKKGIEIATGGKSSGRNWFGKKVAQKVVDRWI